MSAQKNMYPTLTDAEAEVMNVVWEKSPITVREIFEAIKSTRDVAYTTIGTTVKILEEKAFLQVWKGNKAHSFSPNLTKLEYSRYATKNLVNKFFGGVSSGLISNLLSDQDISSEEREAIKKLFEENI